VKVAKAEKTMQMAYGANLSANKQSAFSSQWQKCQGPTTIPQGSTWEPTEKVSPFTKGEDIVCACMKVQDVRRKVELHGN